MHLGIHIMVRDPPFKSNEYNSSDKRSKLCTIRLLMQTSNNEFTASTFISIYNCIYTLKYCYHAIYAGMGPLGPVIPPVAWVPSWGHTTTHQLLGSLLDQEFSQFSLPVKIKGQYLLFIL